jgi:hypothetical protein
MKQLRDKQTGEIVEVIEVRDGWVFYTNGQTRLDHLYEFFEDVTS